MAEVDHGVWIDRQKAFEETGIERPVLSPLAKMAGHGERLWLVDQGCVVGIISLGRDWFCTKHMMPSAIPCATSSGWLMMMSSSRFMKPVSMITVGVSRSTFENTW